MFSRHRPHYCHSGGSRNPFADATYRFVGEWIPASAGMTNKQVVLLWPLGGNMTSKGREIGAFALWIPVALALPATYLLSLRYIAGVRLGLEGAGYIVTLPGGLLAFALFIWLPFFIYRRRATGAPLGAMGASAAALLSAIVLLPFCGSGCFTAQGSARFLGEAGMVFAFFGAYFHDRFSRAYL